MGTGCKSAAICLALALLPVQAQWLHYPAPGTPRTRDGKPDLFAKAPRSAGGKPDLTGVWQTENAPPGENERLFGPDYAAFAVPGDDMRTFSKYSIDILVDFKPGESPLRPEAAEIQRKNAARRAAGVFACLPHGLPRADLFNYSPFKMIQSRDEIAVLYELDDMYRQIYTDGRQLPQDPEPMWLGYSVGRWEGDTLVVDATGFNEQFPLDAVGHPHSAAMRIQERFHRRDFGHMDLSVTVDDPKMYTRPFTVKVTEILVADSDVLESVCNEDEKDVAHLKK